MSASDRKDEKISTRQVKEWRATGRDSTGEDDGMGGERGGTKKGGGGKEVLLLWRQAWPPKLMFGGDQRRGRMKAARCAEAEQCEQKKPRNEKGRPKAQPPTAACREINIGCEARRPSRAVPRPSGTNE